MIASQKIGKSFMGALNYNLKKLYHPDPNQRAELLDTNFTSLDKEQVAREIAFVRELRPNLNRYVYHTSLNFSKEDQIQNTALLSIAHQYLEANGFSNNQYFIFRHYDADHPHLHLLVNRISFDGTVVSDSNNYKKSESILRSIERQYDLVQVLGSKSTPVHAATKDELEMVIRTGKPSEKMLIQEKISAILKQKNLTLSDFIRQGEKSGTRFLFNQASTGRISGITYFHDGFKIKGQALGNSFKWAEIIKKVNYEQVRDSKAISEANSRTRAIYGELEPSGEQLPAKRRSAGQGSAGFSANPSPDLRYDQQQPAFVEGNEATTGFDDAADQQGRERTWQADQDAHLLDNGSRSDQHPDHIYPDLFQISNDIDDEATYGKERRRRRR